MAAEKAEEDVARFRWKLRVRRHLKRESEFVSGFHKRKKKEEFSCRHCDGVDLALVFLFSGKKTEQLVHLVLWLVKTVCLEE
ncbi:hypothetical protein ACLB2K_076339 [Fragaria x ananassa]